MDNKKIISDTADAIRFGAHCRMVRLFYESQRILFPDQFDLVDWQSVYRTLTKEVPKLFQFWARKQVHDVAGTNKELSKRDKEKICPVLHGRSGDGFTHFALRGGRPST